VQFPFEVNPGCMPSAPSNSPLIKWREAISRLGASFAALKIFLPNPCFSTCRHFCAGWNY